MELVERIRRIGAHLEPNNAPTRVPLRERGYVVDAVADAQFQFDRGTVFLALGVVIVCGGANLGLLLRVLLHLITLQLFSACVV